MNGNAPDSQEGGLPQPRCITCGAPRRDGPVCHRCKSDLTPLIALERRVEALRAEARRWYALGWYHGVIALAGEITRIGASPEDFRLLACAGLRCGDFQTACQAYVRCRSLGSQPREEPRRDERCTTA